MWLQYALEWAFENPERVQRVIILNTPLQTGTKMPFELTQYKLPFVSSFVAQVQVLIRAMQMLIRAIYWFCSICLAFDPLGWVFDTRPANKSRYDYTMSTVSPDLGIFFGQSMSIFSTVRCILCPRYARASCWHT